MGKALVMSNDDGEIDVAPTESKTTGTIGNLPHGSRETPQTSDSSMEADRSEKARGHKSDMDVGGESDGLIVPRKRANKADAQYALAAESAEGRRTTKGNAPQAHSYRTQSRGCESQGLWRVRQAARRDRGMQLMHPYPNERLAVR